MSKPAVNNGLSRQQLRFKSRIATSMDQSQADFVDIKSSQLVVFPNVCVRAAKAVTLPFGLLVTQLGAPRDQTVFDQVVGIGDLKPLIDEPNLQKRLVFAASGKSSLMPSLPERAKLLLALHASTSDFEPAHARSVTIGFIRSRGWPQEPSEIDASRPVLLDGTQVGATDAVATISGLALIRPLQTIDPSAWKDALTARTADPDENESFSLTLLHLLGADVEGLWPAMRLFSLGIRSLHAEGREVASALVAAAFESLFPTQGNEGVTSQFKAIGTMLVDLPGMAAWFDTLYTIRSKVFHRGRIESPELLSKHVPRLVRDIELAKLIFQYCVVQLRLLKGDVEATQACRAAKRWWLSRIDERLVWNNAHLCSVLHGTWNPALVRGYRFDSADTSASVLDLLHVGWRLFSLQVDHSRDGATVTLVNKEPIRILRKVIKLLATSESNLAHLVRKLPSDAALKKLAADLAKPTTCEITAADLSAALLALTSSDLRKALHEMSPKLRGALVSKLLEACPSELRDLCEALRLMLLSMLVRYAEVPPKENTVFDFDGSELTGSWCDVVNRWYIESTSAA